jgi:hypothetical protein
LLTQRLETVGVAGPLSFGLFTLKRAEDK